MINLPEGRTMADAVGLFAWMAYRDALLEARAFAEADRAAGKRSGVFRGDPWQLAVRLGFDLDETEELMFIPIAKGLRLQVPLAEFADEAQAAADTKTVVPPINLAGWRQFVRHQDTLESLVCLQVAEEAVAELVGAAVAWMTTTPLTSVASLTATPTVAQLVLAASPFELGEELTDEIWEEVGQEIGLDIADYGELVIEVASSFGTVISWYHLDWFKSDVEQALAERAKEGRCKG